jgi:hypothetical protein
MGQFQLSGHSILLMSYVFVRRHESGVGFGVEVKLKIFNEIFITSFEALGNFSRILIQF